MVGNDVVDLADAETRPDARHPRFDERVFAPCERRHIENAEPDGRLRWILWAAKESAYKVAKRRDPASVFSPARFVVELDAELRGRVRHAGEAFPVQVTLRGDCIHAVATAPGGEPERTRSGVRGLAGDAACASERPGLEARAFAITEIAARLATPADRLHFGLRGRIPRLLDREGREVGDLSLSHHGRFVAYAFAPLAADGEVAR
jgi:phosphopantetheinyl transferase (holo-ACP synthase)